MPATQEAVYQDNDEIARDVAMALELEKESLVVRTPEWGLRLYELAPEFGRIMAALWNADPEDAASIEDLGHQLGELQLALEAKVMGCAHIVHEFEATATALAFEVERLNARCKTLRTKADALKRYMLTSLKQAGLDRVEGARFTVAIRQNPEAVNVTDQSLIPRKYIHIEIIETVNKVGIKAARKAGEAVPGVEFTRGERLEIK
jgi:hypothetical protein